MKIHNIRFLPMAFFILVGMGTLADAAVLAPSPGFVSLTNPTGRPECIVLPNNCIGSGNPSAGFTSFTNPTGRPECIVLPNNCTGIPTINPQLPVTGSVASTPLVALRVDPPADLDISATLGPVTLTALVDPIPPSLENQTITNPEPTTLLLLGSGLTGLLLTRKFAGRSAR